MRRSSGRDPVVPQALVIGFGSPLAGDDAAGPEAAARLDERPGLVVKIVHQLTPELAADVAAAERVIFVDAAMGGGAVRAVSIVPIEDAPAATHALNPQDVLSLARAVYGRIPPAFLVTIPGRQFSLGRGLSPLARRAIPAALRAVRRLLRGSSPNTVSIRYAGPRPRSMLAVEIHAMAETAERPYVVPTITLLRNPMELAGLEIDPGLGAFSGYSRRRTEVVRESLGKALRIPGAEVFAAVLDSTIVGYLLLVPAGPDQPWGRLNDPRVLELGIEVARRHRSHGVAQALFRQAFSRPEVESRIYVATAYVWCWDIEDTGLAANIYADRLLRLFERFGFRREWTNEPNVAMESANFLAVRVGRQVAPDLIRRFRQAQRGERAA